MTFSDKTILITGGAGSLGTAFAKYLIDYPPHKLIILSRDSLKHNILKDKLGNPKWLRVFVGDVRDKDRLIRAFHGVDIVIHAAAMKDIEACEYNPSETMETNVRGTQNVIDACIECQVDKCLFISTDKACNPINTYGTSKAMAEKLWLNANNYAASNDIQFSFCRYGNVIGSNGSVVPLFKKLIKQGVTELPVTDERMTRFWFPINDAVALIVDCLDNMQGGETYIPNISSIRITDLCKAMGKPHKIIGIRPGEKIHEELDIGYNSCENRFLTIAEIKESIKDVI